MWNQWQLCIYSGRSILSGHTESSCADTVGAGDSFTAAFTSAILSGKSVPEAHKLAVEVSAYVCTQSGAMPELPYAFKSRLE